MQIPQLVVAPEPRNALDLEAGPGPYAEVWRDAEGHVFAHCLRRDGLYEILVPAVASFRFDERGDVVTALRHPAIDSEALSRLYAHSILPMVLPALGTEVLHASAVRTPRGVAVFCGSTGTGKSTLAVGLARRGYPQWADDAVALDLSGPSTRVIPLPFEVRLRPPAAEFFESGRQNGSSVGRGTLLAAPSEAPVPLASLAILSRTPVPRSLAVERLPPARALTALLPHAYCFALDQPDLKRRMVEQYLELTRRVPVLVVRFAPGLEALPTVLDGLERWMLDGGARPG